MDGTHEQPLACLLSVAQGRPVEAPQQACECQTCTFERRQAWQVFEKLLRETGGEG